MDRGTGPAASGVRVGPVDPNRLLDATERLVSASVPSDMGPGALTNAARAFVEQANNHGLDISRMFATTTENGAARQVSLAVPSPGRTASVFVSGPGHAPRCGQPETQARERAESLECCWESVSTEPGTPIKLLQALPTSDEQWFAEALDRASFTRVGELAYMKREMGPRERPNEESPLGELPPGVTCRSARALGAGADAAVVRALDASYVGTLDCPKLCGLRETSDVLESHKRSGVCDLSAWHILLEDDTPKGCMLLNRVPEQDAVELVYIGLGPSLRGRGIAGLLLNEAVRHTLRVGAARLTCAVDRANSPALRLYASRRFEPFASRLAFVRPVRQ
ncbi:MAG: GNAT family N-acetyltransferase [Planctomycetota bacterium]